MTLDAVFPVLTLLLGALASFLAENHRQARVRRFAIADTLRHDRLKVYLEYLEAAHGAAHTLGRTARACPHPLEPDPDRFWQVDSEVTRRLRTLEIIGGDEAIAASRDVRGALLDFRKAVASGITYDSAEYWESYRPVSNARDALIAAARRELTLTYDTGPSRPAR